MPRKLRQASREKKKLHWPSLRDERGRRFLEAKKQKRRKNAFQRSPRSSRELRTWATRFLLNESNATAAGGDIMSCGCCYYYEDDEEYYKRNETSADSTQNQTVSLARILVVVFFRARLCKLQILVHSNKKKG